MKKIEFIGSSGVGKSTLFHEVSKRRTPENPWLTPSEARVAVVKAMAYRDYRSFVFRMLLAYVKGNFFQKHQPLIASIMLQKLNCSHYLIKYEPIIGITLDTLVNDYTMEAYRKGEFIKFYMNLIHTDVLLSEKIADDQLVVFDDGLFHNSDGIGNEKYAYVWMENDPKLLRDIFPAGVIFCELSVEEIFQRRKNRIKAGKGTMVENDLSDKELWENCLSSVRESFRTVNFLTRQGIPILNTKMENDQEYNMKLINQFIQELNGEIAVTV